MGVSPVSGGGQYQPVSGYQNLTPAQKYTLELYMEQLQKMEATGKYDAQAIQGLSNEINTILNQNPPVPVSVQQKLNNINQFLERAERGSYSPAQWEGVTQDAIDQLQNLIQS